MREENYRPSFYRWRMWLEDNEMKVILEILGKWTLDGLNTLLNNCCVALII